MLQIDAGGGALLFADSLIHYGEVGFVPDNLIGDEPERVKEEIRQPRRGARRRPTSSTSCSPTARRCSGAAARRWRRSRVEDGGPGHRVLLALGSVAGGCGSDSDSSATDGGATRDDAARARRPHAGKVPGRTLAGAAGAAGPEAVSGSGRHPLPQPAGRQPRQPTRASTAAATGPTSGTAAPTSASAR